MPLQLRFRLEPHVAEQIIGDKLETVVGKLPLRSLFSSLNSPGRRTVRFEKLELTAVMGEAKTRVRTLATNTGGDFSVRGEKAGILDFTVRCAVALRKTAHAEQPPADASACTGDLDCRSQLLVVRRSIGFNADLVKPRTAI